MITITDFGTEINKEILVKANDVVNYFYVATHDNNIKRKIILQANAHVTICSAVLAGHNQQEIVIEHVGAGATSNHYGLFFGKEHDHYLMNYWSNHMASNTTGHIKIHGVLLDAAYADVKGDIKIQPTGKQTSASLVEAVLLLGDKARAETIPQLEIATNNVQASHSSAITTIDEEQLFYLQSRGLALAEARRMIMMGFLAEILQEFNNNDMQKQIINFIKNKLSPPTP
ncbi:MAG: SufD family Fe-S cluster assembly protein [Patescibacteria group bacterium]|jgi:Fe-S cluster assembly protein SufD